MNQGKDEAGSPSAGLRILHLDGGRDWGGGQRQVSLLSRWQHARGDDVTVAAPAGSPLARRLRGSGVAVISLGRPRPWNPATWWRIARAASRRGIDVVHSHTADVAAVAGILRRVGRLRRHVYTRRTAFPVRGLAAGLRARWAYGGGIDGLIAISHAAAEPVRSAGARPRRLAIIPSAVEVPGDETGPPPGSLPELAGVVPEGWRERPLVGALGSLTPNKGHEVLLGAWPRVVSRHPGARLIIAGDGPARPRLERRIEVEGLGDTVRLAGWIEEPAVLRRRLSVLVHPADNEALGNAVLEAMADGVPVVASAVGGVPEALASGAAGLLVPPRDPWRLAAALGRLLDDRDLARRLGSAGRERARSVYALERVGPAVDGFYRGLVG